MDESTSMYFGLGLDDRPLQDGSKRPYLTRREFGEFVASKQVPDSFVRHCLSVRWVRMDIRLGQFWPLNPSAMEVRSILRRRSLRWQQQFRQKSPFAVPDQTGAGRPACSIVPISGALSRLEAMGYTESDLDASNPYTRWARGE